MSDKKLGKCIKCGTAISPNAFGYCLPCAEKVHEEIERDAPFVVRFGSDFERFSTRKEAEKFLDELHSAYIDEP